LGNRKTGFAAGSATSDLVLKTLVPLQAPAPYVAMNPAPLLVSIPPGLAASPDLLAFLPAGDGQTLQAIYYFSVLTSAMKPLGGAASALALAGYNLVWVSAFDYGIAVGALTSGGSAVPAARFFFLPWGQLDSAAAITQIDVPLPIGSLSPDNAALADLSFEFVTALSPQAAPDQPTPLSLVCLFELTDGGGISINPIVGEIPVRMIDGRPSLDVKGAVWPGPLANASGAPLFSLKLSKAPDGRLFASAAQAQHTTNPGIVTYTPRLWARTAAAVWTELAAPVPDGIVAITYLPGAVQESRSPVNPSLRNATQPVDRVYLRLATAGHDPSTTLGYATQPYGVMRRTGLGQVTPARKLLVGIVEGPPPIPIENINLNAKYDPRNPAAANQGTTSITFALEKTSMVSVDVSAALVAKVEAQGESVAGSFEFSAGYGYVSETSTTVTTTTTYQQTLSLEEAVVKGQTVLAPQADGAAFFFGADATGFVYDFVDANSQPVPNSVQYIQITPLNPAVSVMPYVMNPHAEPYPGDLLSYVLTADEQEALAQNAVISFDTATGSKPYITNSWSAGGGKVGETYNSYTVERFTHSLMVDVKAMAGPAFDGACLGKGKALFGVQLKLKVSWSGAVGDRQGVFTDVGTLGNVHAPASYVDYSYNTYQLRENPQWAADLQNELIVRDANNHVVWPTDPNELRANQEVLDTIGGGSSPWKICYALGSYHFNQPVELVLGTLPRELADAIRRTNARSTGALHFALEAVKNPDSAQRLVQAVVEAPHVDKPAYLAFIRMLQAAPASAEELRSALGEAQRAHVPEAAAHLRRARASQRVLAAVS
jgi:hypothetical protein